VLEYACFPAAGKASGTPHDCICDHKHNALECNSPNEHSSLTGRYLYSEEFPFIFLRVPCIIFLHHSKISRLPYCWQLWLLPLLQHALHLDVYFSRTFPGCKLQRLAHQHILPYQTVRLLVSPHAERQVQRAPLQRSVPAPTPARTLMAW
jgi:hypothetical protein